MSDRLFDDYFSVRLATKLVPQWLDPEATIPAPAELDAELPPLYHLFADLRETESELWSQLREEQQSPLARLLALQSQKLDRLLDQLLVSDIDLAQAIDTVHFSAGGFSIARAQADSPLVKVVLTLPGADGAPAGQIYAYARQGGSDAELAYYEYVSILEEDREKLVRTALKVQSEQLRARRARDEEN
ncbi:hypothetical protein [Gallaecimonas sp. GXIMD4217]|uniref:hypothetical protein n=1 Tax=Gallaecimonas sp. GXIMD4217 TaxID=3131927 RepID=UPI00311B2859